MEILSKLPPEIKSKIFLFMQHPVAKIINDSIINEECDEDSLRLLFYSCYFYIPMRKYYPIILLRHTFYR
jgi:hypothetical protein